MLSRKFAIGYFYLIIFIFTQIYGKDIIIAQLLIAIGLKLKGTLILAQDSDCDVTDNISCDSEGDPEM